MRTSRYTPTLSQKRYDLNEISNIYRIFVAVIIFSRHMQLHGSDIFELLYFFMFSRYIFAPHDDFGRDAVKIVVLRKK